MTFLQFVLAAAGICGKLISSGYWADFINPFSGRPYFCRQKNDSLYKTDERFRCVGFKVEERMYCKIIESDNKNFIGKFLHFNHLSQNDTKIRINLLFILFFGRTFIYKRKCTIFSKIV